MTNKILNIFYFEFKIKFKLYCNSEIVHFDTGAEGDYLAHVTFFARAKRVRKVT